jgi:diguanylate cyclase (GGDEF)-like protein
MQEHTPNAKPAADRQSLALIKHLISLDYEYLALIDVKTATLTKVLNPSQTLTEALASGIPYKDYAARSIAALLPPEYRADATAKFTLAAITKALQEKTAYALVYPVLKADAVTVYKKWRFTWLEETRQTLVATRSDVTFDYQANFDVLTGLFNRRTFVTQAAAMLQKKPAGSYVIISLDLNNFKVVNDRFGHAAGDKALRLMGESMLRLRNNREDVLVAHDVADTFLVLQPNTPDLKNNILKTAGEITAHLGVPIPITCRAGIFVVENPTLDVNLMIDRAMLAQMTIKGRSDACLALYDDSLRQNILEEQQLTDSMETALKEHQFQVWFQPQYDYDTGSLIGAEALVRWQHPEKGLLPPGKFIPLFERNGFITKLDEFVWEESCRYLHTWQQDTSKKDVPVSVNVSRVDIYNPELCAILTRLIHRYDLTPSQLKLEITESAYMENSAQLIRIVKLLHAAGFSVEMDDFGSGFSSLNMLKTVPVDLLKLDLRFLEAGDEERGGNILSSVIRMAHWLKLPVVAEGVETKTQADYLKSLNCALMQGYYFARPMPAADFAKLLSHSKISQPHLFSNLNLEGAASFWDPSAQTALLFNSFVGGAAIVEYHNDNLEIIRTNDNFYRELGSTREEFSSYAEHCLEDFDVANRARMQEMLTSAITSGAETECTVLNQRLSTQHASKCWTHNRARLLAQNGDRYLFYIAVENCSQEKHLQEELEESNRLLELSINQMGKIICRYDLKEHTLYMPEAYAKQHNVPQVITHVPESLRHTVVPEMWPAYKNFYERLGSESNFTQTPIPFKNQDGTVSWESCQAISISNENGEPRQAILTIEDVTGHRNQEAENTRNRLIVEQIGIGIFDYDVLSDYLHFEIRLENNNLFRKNYHHYWEYLAESKIIHPDYREHLRARIKESSQKPTTGIIEYRADLWGSGFRWVRLHYTSLADNTGKVYRMVGTVSDVQAEKDREELLRKLQENLQTPQQQNSYNSLLVERAFQLLYAADDARETINKLLGLLGSYYRTSRAYVLLLSSQSREFTLPFFWQAPATPAPNLSQRVIKLTPAYQAYARHFGPEGQLVCEDATNSDPQVQQVLQLFGAKATLQFSLVHKGVFQGIIGFDDVTGPRTWDKETIASLKIISRLIGLFITIPDQKYLQVKPQQER